MFYCIYISIAFYFKFGFFGTINYLAKNRSTLKSLVADIFFLAVTC